MEYDTYSYSYQVQIPDCPMGGIPKDIRQKKSLFVYSFFEHGYKIPGVFDHIKPEEGYASNSWIGNCGRSGDLSGMKL